jgi:hypothetical protein
VGDENSICGYFRSPVFDCALAKIKAVHGAADALDEIFNLATHLEILTEEFLGKEKPPRTG